MIGLPQVRSLALVLIGLGAMVLARAAEAVPVKRVALVFDDGPRPADAGRLLALLARENLHVTFSLVGDRVRESPAVAKAIVAAGHEVANHSQTHAHPRELDDAALDREVAGAQREIVAVTGFTPQWYWPPFLEVDDRVRAATARAGLVPYTPRHLVVSMDYDRAVPAAEIYRRATTDARDGTVILFHEWRAETREQLPAILATLRQQGCVFLTFSALQASLTASETAEAPVGAAPGPSATWTADNGNGTFTNPLFYDEFSDPDLIRVGDDYYLTGTTMHAQPGLPILHSKDLVNWELLGYACERLDLGPEFRLEDGKDSYGQGIWAPCLRYHHGVFHLFTNINGHTTQHFQANHLAGPWTRTAMKVSLHDLSVLFDDDGKAYVVWGYGDIQFAQLNDDLTDLVPGTHRTLIASSAGMGEGLHFYKIDGRYFITSAWYKDHMRMACARADRLEGPYAVNPAISIDEDFGLAEGRRLRGGAGPPFDVVPANPASRGRMSLHQGGLVATPAGGWWGFSMMDFNSVGRLTCLSPVTWQDGWPYFGLPGNLRRTPRTWVKPDTGVQASPAAPYQRSDDFSGPRLQAVWQWNHLPDDTRWSLAERPGFLRLHALAAADFWRARDTLTQRAIGPQSTATTFLDARGLQPGDVAGLALLNFPYAWVGVRRGHDGLTLEQFDQRTGETSLHRLAGPQVWLRARCNFLLETATLGYSEDGRIFHPLGAEGELVFQLKTFQGVRYGLFAFNDAGTAGGCADFDFFALEEPHPHGLVQPIPYSRVITLTVHDQPLSVGIKDGIPTGAPADAAAVFTVVDRGLGRVQLRAADGRVLAVVLSEGQARVVLTGDAPSTASSFQWIENFYGDLLLLSLASDRYLCIDPGTGVLSADHPGPAPDRRDGSCFTWHSHES